MRADMTPQVARLRCLFVGDGPQDPGFARRLGFTYRTASEFFPAGSLIRAQARSRQRSQGKATVGVLT